jgi:hypothetical protein
MNMGFLIVFTGNGLVFATLLYLIMTCEIPDREASSRYGLWTKSDDAIYHRREASSNCQSSIATLPREH